MRQLALFNDTRIGYFDAKHDQDKPDPFTDDSLIWNRKFMFKTRLAFDAMRMGEWEALLEYIPLTNRTLGIAEVMRYGAEKYSWDSWRTVPDALHRYKAAAVRHFLWEKYYPEDSNGLDGESGFSHLSHAACNIAFVLELL